MDWKLELVAIPVSDVDRAKAFYIEKAGFTPTTITRSPTSCGSCSSRRRDRTARSPSASVSPSRTGSAQLQLVVSDVHAARAELAGRGVDVSDVQDFAWGSFVFFDDPDGNRWAVQQLPPTALAHARTTRPPGSLTHIDVLRYIYSHRYEVRTVMEVVIVSTTLEPVVCCAARPPAAMSDDEASAAAELFRAGDPARPDREPRRDERRAGARASSTSRWASPSRPSPTI